MAPVALLYRLVWGGRLFDKESWSCSMHIGSDAGLNLAASNMQAALVAWMGRTDSQISSAAHLDFVKFNQINPLTAKYSLPTSNELIQNDLSVGAIAPTFGQNTLAISLRTALARGRSHTGRFYAPTGLMGIDPATGLTGATQATQAATSAATLITAINTVVGPGSRVVVFSKIGQLVQPVIGTRVGLVMDTMRSRRAQLLENYISASI